MPILNDIMDHDVLGLTFREGEKRACKKASNKAYRRVGDIEVE